MRAATSCGLAWQEAFRLEAFVEGLVFLGCCFKGKPTRKAATLVFAYFDRPLQPTQGCPPLPANPLGGTWAWNENDQRRPWIVSRGGQRRSGSPFQRPLVQWGWGRGGVDLTHPTHPRVGGWGGGGSFFFLVFFGGVQGRGGGARGGKEGHLLNAIGPTFRHDHLVGTTFGQFGLPATP